MTRMDSTQHSPVMVRGLVPADRGVQGIANRLRETIEELATVERRRARLRANRKLLSRKLIRAGLSERQVASLAAVSGPAVHSWREADD